jgi:ElaB/YqjD/DUF883 family membrane-anchored ribosome-binding protein
MTHSKHSLDSVGEKAGELLDEIVTLVKKSEASENIKDELLEYSKEAEDYIQKHPIASVSVALGVGVLLGILLAR